MSQIINHDIPDDHEIQIEKKFIPKDLDIDKDISWARINKDVLRSLDRPRPIFWVIFFAALALFSFGVYCEKYQYENGLGVADLNNPQVWGLYIATFIFWIGMGHSGTLLSALLHIIHADWRKPILHPIDERAPERGRLARSRTQRMPFPREIS